MSASVLIYLTEWCPFCQRAKALLKKKKVNFTEIDVDDRPELRSWLTSASGQRTVPQVFINGQPVGGYTDLEKIDRQGKLDALLAQASAPGDPVLPV
ncbi:MAG: glutaredoxin 3 [Byssovorax sp.]